MREHPIPQDVTGYKFHIIGNMTLKQFAEVAIGVVVGVIFYNTNLVLPIKWFLILASVGFGAMLAFVPIEERPLDHWVSTFFKRLYKPTKFFWKKENEVPFSFTYKKPEDQPETPEVEIDLSPAKRSRITEYLKSVQTPKVDLEPWEQVEQNKISTVLQAFDDVEVKKVSIKPQKVKPNLTPRVRNLAARDEDEIKSPTPLKKEQMVFETPVAKPVVDESIPITSLTPTVSVPEQPIRKQNNQNLSQVELNKSLPFPKAPTEPNKVVGMILTTNNKLVDRATITLRNQNGDAIRSIRSNLLGQFHITGTLPNGTFTLEVEKSGVKFPKKQLTLSGQIVEPLEIRASA